MDRQKWSVRLLLEASDATAISGTEHLMAVLTFGGVHGLALGGGHYEDDPSPWVTIEVAASTWHAARTLAQHLVGLAFSSAGLRPRELPVAWVAPLADTRLSSLRFLEHARDLLRDEMYDLAVVAAQIHVESHLNALVQQAMVADRSALVHAVVQERRWNLTHSSGRRVLEALLGIRLGDFERWQEYNEHLTRRNVIIHGGGGVEAELARESVEIVDALWRWLNDAVSPVGHPGVASSTATARGQQLGLFPEP